MRLVESFPATTMLNDSITFHITFIILQNEIIKEEKDDMMRASFHFPLHRYLAAFTCQAVSKMNMTLKDIIPPPDLLTLLMVHPLRVQVNNLCLIIT